MIARKCIVISIFICLTQMYDASTVVQKILENVMEDMTSLCDSQVVFRYQQSGEPLPPNVCTTDPQIFKHPDLCLANIGAIHKICTLFRSSRDEISSYALKISADIAYIETSRGRSWSFEDFCDVFGSIVSNPLYVTANREKNQPLVDEERMRKINDEVRSNCAHMCLNAGDDPKTRTNLGCEMLLVWNWLLLEYAKAEKFNQRNEIWNELYELTANVTDQSDDLTIKKSPYTTVNSSFEYSTDNLTTHKVSSNNVRNDIEYDDGDEEIPSLKSTDINIFQYGVSRETSNGEKLHRYILGNMNSLRALREAVQLQAETFSYTANEMSKLVENERNQTNMLRSLMKILSNSKVTKTITIENDLFEE